MSENTYTYSPDSSLVSEGRGDESIAWTTARSIMDYTLSSDSNNEHYVTGDEDNTRYLSVLESTNDMTLEDLNISLVNPKIDQSEQYVVEEETHQNIENFGDATVETELTNTIDASGQQVVVFSLEGSDDLYGIQFAQDEHGNLQKYQFKLQTNEDGQLEAVADTIQLLPVDETETEAASELEQNTNEQDFVHEQEHVVTQQEMQNINSELIENNNSDLTFPVENTEAEFAVIQQECEEVNEERANFEGFDDNIDQIHEEETNEEAEDDIESKQGILNSYHSIKEEIFNENSQQHSPIFEENDVADEQAIESEEQNFEEGEEETVLSISSMHGENIYENINKDVDDGQQIFITEEPAEENENQMEKSQQYEEIFVESLQPSLNTFTNKSFIKYNLADQTEKETDACIEEHAENDSDNDDYQIVEGLHITGDIEESTTSPQDNVLQENLEKPVAENSNILQTQLIPTALKELHQEKDTGRVYYYVLTNTEKENVNSFSLLNSALCRPLKNNPRSILKSSHVETVKPKKEKVIEACPKKTPRRKELVEERLFVNFINHTTIPHAPIRNERLPRKQKIKPVERQDEEIIVQEVVVSSNGFIETLEDGILKSKEPLKVTECVTLIDSDDEYDHKHKKRKSKKKKEKTITISDSSESDDNNSIIEINTDVEESGTNNPVVPRRGRGRPKKTTEEVITFEIEEGSTDLESSPSKRRRGRPFKHSRPEVEDEKKELHKKKSKTEDDYVPNKKEIKCPQCMKTFPSENSLKTHLLHHNLENNLKNAQKAESKARPSTSSNLFKKPNFDYKHKCENCCSVFKNGILLSKHVCSNASKQIMCSICKKHFPDQSSLNVHKRLHVKENLQRSTSFVKVSPKKPNKINKLSTFKQPQITSKCLECGKLCSSEALLNIHIKSHKKFNCSTCGTVFPSRILLDTHLREKCVKIKSPMNRRLSFKIRKSFLQSPQRVAAKKLATSTARKSTLTTSTRKSTFAATARKSIIEPSARKSTLAASAKKTTHRVSSRKSGLPLFLKTPLLGAKNNKFPCESCKLKFSSYSELFNHKVVIHGKDTVDKKNVIASANESKSNQLHKKIDNHPGFSPNVGIKRAIRKARSNFLEPY